MKKPKGTAPGRVQRQGVLEVSGRSALGRTAHPDHEARKFNSARVRFVTAAAFS